MASTLLSYISASLVSITHTTFTTKHPTQSPNPPSPQPTTPLIPSIDSSLAHLTLSSSHQTLTLPSNLKLGYATFGAPTSPTTKTIFYLHGFGDSRLSGAWFASSAHAQNLRIIAIDRPGIGLSDPQPDRTLLSHAEDIRLLAAHLGVESYSILAVSGGGPYALACAHALPAAQLKAVSIVCGMGPFDLAMRCSTWSTYLMFRAYKLFPGYLYRSSAAVVKDLQSKTLESYIAETKFSLDGAWYTRFFGLGPSGVDAALVRDEKFLTLVYEAAREGLKHGVEGHMAEWEVMTSGDGRRELGFELEGIRKDLPVDFWCGLRDANISWQVGEAMALAVGGQARLVVRDETHLSLPLVCGGEILEGLAERM